VGQTVGNYLILERIGEGGAACVYLAQHPVIGRKVALKVLPPEASPEVRERFLDEARITAGLRDPRLVEVFDFGALPEGGAYIVMEYLEGEDLEARLLRRGRLPAAQAVGVAREIALAVEVVHRAGFVHRDLKPANVFLARASGAPQLEGVKVLDLGVAKPVRGAASRRRNTQRGALVGTPTFMAPEQFHADGGVDVRTDVYSLGCILFAMLCGRPPFERDDLGALASAHVLEPPPPARALEPTLSPELEALIAQALAKDPAARHQSMAELAAALDEVPERRPGAARPVRRARGRTAAPAEDGETSPSRTAAPAEDGGSSATLKLPRLPRRPGRAAWASPRDAGAGAGA
jgi:eukaryotic-like serine/threonine-protein kinase